MRLGVFTFFNDTAVGPVDVAVALETRGFGSLFVAEHSHIPVNAKTPYPMGGPIPPQYYRTLDPFVSLTAAAVATESLLVGTGIALVTQRDPIQTAKEVASLDLVSQGRFLFGVGVGWLREEIANHGVDPRVRGRVMDERLRAMIEIWTKDEAAFHGEVCRLRPDLLLAQAGVQAAYTRVHRGRTGELLPHHRTGCRLALAEPFGRRACW